MTSWIRFDESTCAQTLRELMVYYNKLDFKPWPNSRRPSHISASVVAAGWVRALESAAVTRVAGAVSIWSRISRMSIRLPAVRPQRCPRPTVRLQKSLQVLQIALQVELDS